MTAAVRVPAVLLLAALAVKPAAAGGFDHSAWDGILARRVDDEGRVAYRDLRTQDGAALDAYLVALAAARPEGWPRPEQIAFWLNAYNAVIVRAVLDGRSAETLFGRYRLFWRYTRPVAGEARTPDEIENDILRRLGEPRVHFALVCASSSCPKLRRQAWTGETLDPDLDAATRAFLSDPRRNDLRPGRPVVRLSMIFDWYEEDFGGSPAAVRAYVAPYVDEATRRHLVEQQPALEYLPYDWTMNAQPGQRPG